MKGKYNMLKKILAISAAVIFTFSCGCQDGKTNYVNKGSSREVTLSSDIESSDTNSGQSDDNLVVLQTIKENYAGLYTGEVTETKGNAKEKANGKMMINSNLTLSVSAALKESKGIYFNGVYGNYSTMKNGNETNYYGIEQGILLKDYFITHFVDALVNKGLLTISNDKSKIKIDVTNNSLYSALCSAIEKMADDYEAVYLLTKDNKEFNDYIKEILGGEYNTEHGISSNAYKEYLANWALIFTDKLISNESSPFNFTVIIDKDMNIEFEYATRINDSDYSLAGKLKKESSDTTNIDKAEKNDAELLKKTKKDTKNADNSQADENSQKDISDNKVNSISSDISSFAEESSIKENSSNSEVK